MLARRLSLALLVSTLLGCNGDPAGPPSSSTSASPAMPSPSATVVSSAAQAPASGSAASGSAASGSAVASGSAAAAAAPTIAAVPGAAAALVKDPPRPADGKGAGFVGPIDIALDSAWIERLASAEITEIKPNTGGSSVSMRVKFADGNKAALKPEQTGRPTDPRAEVAAYHVDRLLGFARSAAVAGRKLAAADVRAALVAAKADATFLDRFDRLVVVHDGHIDVAMIAWHTAPLVEEEIAPAWTAALETKEAVSGEAETKLAEWSDLVVFDFLVDNPDRFSGGNILRLNKDGPIVFLDQGAGFGKGRLRDKLTTRDRLDKVCRFRGATLAALRAVGPTAGAAKKLGAVLRTSLAKDPIAPVLDDAQLAAIDERAAAVLAHAGSCEGRLGAASGLGSASSRR